MIINCWVYKKDSGDRDEVGTDYLQQGRLLAVWITRVESLQAENRLDLY